VNVYTNGHHSDVVVVGGGVIGAAILFELARKGVRATLLERGLFATESTGKSAAIVRTNYSNPAVVRMAIRSRDIFRSFAELTNGQDVYKQCGWLMAVPDDYIGSMSQLVDMNRREGVDVYEITVDEAREHLPGLVSDDVACVFFEPLSGCADPHATTLGYIAAARHLGAVAHEHTPATELVTDGGRVTGVRTEHHVFQADQVVLAAGAWSAKLAKSIGLEVPLEITREEELYLQLRPDDAPRAAFSDVVDRVYMRPLFEVKSAHPGRIILGRGFPKAYETCDPDSYDDVQSDAFVDDVCGRLATRFPRLADAAVVGGVVGLYAVTPDWHPYLGPAPGYDGLMLATGGSGHCFKLAPAIGEMVASAITNDQIDYADIETFSLGRFAAGDVFVSAIGGNRA
jgi:glycine/D-amino acid oxidase-like deaminating enzyme